MPSLFGTPRAIPAFCGCYDLWQLAVFFCCCCALFFFSFFSFPSFFFTPALEQEEEEFGYGEGAEGVNAEMGGWDSDDDWWSDSDEEPEGPDWVVRTKQQIADAQPHDDEFWNCWHCEKQVLGTTFVSYPADESKNAPAVRVHIFECALEFRRKYEMVWDWEVEVGVPKEGFNPDGTKIGSLEDSNMATRRPKPKKKPFLQGKAAQ